MVESLAAMRAGMRVVTMAMKTVGLLAVKLAVKLVEWKVDQLVEWKVVQMAD